MVSITTHNRTLLFTTERVRGLKRLANTYTITKQQAKRIVEPKNVEYYKDYTDAGGFFGNPLESFESLLKQYCLTGKYNVYETNNN
jgi:hypothetical protein